MSTTTYPQPVKRRVPQAIRNDVVTAVTNKGYDANNIITTPTLKTVGTFTLRSGDSFTSGVYDYSYDITDAGQEFWSFNFKGANLAATSSAPAGQTPAAAVDLSAYAKLDSPALVGKPTTPTAAIDAKDEQAANTSWVRSFVQSQLHLSPFTITAGTSNVLYVSSTFSAGTLGPEKNNPNRPYPTGNAAVTAATEGDILVFMPGTHAGGFTVNKKVDLFWMPGAKTTAFNIGNYAGDLRYAITSYGGIFTETLLQFRQTVGPNVFHLRNPTFLGNGGVQTVCNDTTGSHVDTIRLTNFYIDSSRVLPPPTGVNTYRGPVRINSRLGFGPAKVILDGGTIITQGAPCVTFSVPVEHKELLELRGHIEFRAGNGTPPIEVMNNEEGGGTPVYADLVRDYRSDILYDAADNSKYRLGINTAQAGSPLVFSKIS